MVHDLRRLSASHPHPRLPADALFFLSSSASSVTLFLLASWLVLYGVRLQRRVMGHPR